MTIINRFKTHVIIIPYFRSSAKQEYAQSGRGPEMVSGAERQGQF